MAAGGVLDTLGRAYAWARIMSLDVVAGAVAGGVAADKLHHSALPPAWLLLLALGTWAVYSADHLMDAWRLKERASTARHRYHYRHFKVILALAVLATVAAVVLTAWLLGWKGLGFGASMAGLAAAHIVLVKLAGANARRWMAKELGVAVVYVLGIWGLPMLYAGGWRDPWAWLPCAMHFMAGMMNLLACSVHEYEIDRADGQSSVVLAWGRPAATWMTHGLLLGLVLLGVCLGLAEGGWGWPVLAVAMGAVQSALLLWPRFFARDERYRAAGDAAFVLPLLVFLA